MRSYSHLPLLLVFSTLSVSLSAEPAADQGRVFFKEKGCIQCHTLNGEGGTKGPVLDGVGKRLSKEAIENQIRDGGMMMPAFVDALTPEEIDAITEFLVRSAKTAPPAKAR